MSNNNLIMHSIPNGMSSGQFFEMEYHRLIAENMSLRAQISVLQEDLSEFKLERIESVVKSNEEVEKVAAKKIKQKVSWAEATTKDPAPTNLKESVAITLGLPKDAAENEVLTRFKTFTQWVSEVTKAKGGNVYNVLGQAVKQKYVFTNLHGFNTEDFLSAIGKSPKDLLKGFNSTTYDHIDKIDLSKAFSAIAHKLTCSAVGGVDVYNKMSMSEAVVWASRIRDMIEMIKGDNNLIWPFIASCNSSSALEKRAKLK